MHTVDAVETLVLDHLQLVEHEVRPLLRRMPAHVERDELVSTGFVALVSSARRFTGENGVQFAQTARLRVRGALLDHLRELDWASRGVRRKAHEIESAKAELTSSLGRTPTATELADALGVAEADLAATVNAVRQAAVLSLQAITTGTNEVHVAGHVCSPEEVTLRRELTGYLHIAVAALPTRLRKVITEGFFEERPVAETAAELDVSQSRVSQMRGEALQLLRDGLNAYFEPGRMAAEPNRGRTGRRRQAYFAAIAARCELNSSLVCAEVAPDPGHTAA